MLLPINFGLEKLFQSPWPKAPYLPSPVVSTRPVLLTNTLKFCPAPTLPIQYYKYQINYIF